MPQMVRQHGEHQRGYRVLSPNLGRIGAAAIPTCRTVLLAGRAETLPGFAAALSNASRRRLLAAYSEASAARVRTVSTRCSILRMSLSIGSSNRLARYCDVSPTSTWS